MDLNIRLKKAREEKGYSQLYVADKINIGNKSLSDWERGIAEPDSETLPKLAKLYGVTTDYLLGLSDEPHPVKKPITENDFLVAFSNIEGDLTEEQKKQMLDIANAYAMSNEAKKGK